MKVRRSCGVPVAKPKPADDAPACGCRPALPARLLRRSPRTSAPRPLRPPPPAGHLSDDDSDRPVLKRPAAEAAPAASAPSPAAAGAGRSRSGSSGPEARRADGGGVEKAQRLDGDRQRQSRKDSHKPKTLRPPQPAPIQLIPAISDAAGPDPRPYAYSLKPEEEQKLRKKILALAADEVRAWAAQPESVAPQRRLALPGPASKAKPPQPTFEDVQLHAFDLSNSNEPVLVLTAKARMPARPNAASDLQYIITLVARDDIYGDLHKAFASVTDTGHFDVLSRLELIDAVDADGDGRGELLFRQVSDAGSAFVLYRVIGDRLWPLFQGTPGQ